MITNENGEKAIGKPIGNYITIDMKKIHSEIYSLPKDAYFELEPYKIYADVDGIDLTVSPEDAQKVILEENKDFNSALQKYLAINP